MNESQALNPNRYLDYSKFHKIKNKIKPLLLIHRDSNFNPTLTSEQLSLGFSIRFTPDNRPYFPASQNKTLMQDLKELGFFQVFCTNSAGDKDDAFGVYLSQVSMFFEYGIEWVRASFKLPQDSVELHHLNSNVLDNRVSNVSVVSSTVHSFLSTLQVGKDVVSRPQLSPSFVIYNNKGDVLKGMKALCKLGWLLHETIRRTKLWLKAVVHLLGTPTQDTTDLDTLSSYGFDMSVLQQVGSKLDELYLSAINSHSSQHTLGMSWNWLLQVKSLSLPSILSNLKCAATQFLRNALKASNISSFQLLSTLCLV